ncbi:hypothetical protein F4777DRAFT_40991 [Nemania sp. FL0916]|nr:hypothetical protein F4777DRAFT_40991 [Nemania sp. FL0916]
MASKLILPPCADSPAHMHHPPPPDKPLRIQVGGHLDWIDQLFDDGTKIFRPEATFFSLDEYAEPCLRLIKMSFNLLYGRDPDPETPLDMVLRYQSYIFQGRTGDKPPEKDIPISYYFTFDHLVGPENDLDPDTLMLNLVDPNDHQHSQLVRFDVGPYTSGSEPVMLLVPRCCQTRKGTQDRGRINIEVETSKMTPDERMKRYDEDARVFKENKARKKALKAQRAQEAQEAQKFQESQGEM